MLEMAEGVSRMMVGQAGTKGESRDNSAHNPRRIGPTDLDHASWKVLQSLRLHA
jgi:hypothetical protein